MKPALMVIDMQKAYSKAETAKSMESASEYIDEAISYFRNKKLPIVWVYHMDKDKGVVPGKPEFEMMDSLKPQEGDYKVHKEYSNSFNKTDCHKILKENGVDTIIITGFCAEYCVLSTYRGAQDIDLTPIMLVNGLASVDTNNISFVEKISQVISYAALKKMLENF